MRGPSPMCQPSTQSTAERHAQRRKIRHLLNTVTPHVKRDWCFAFERLTGRKVVQSLHISFVRLWACLYLYFFNSHFCFSLSPFFFSLSIFHSPSLFFFFATFIYFSLLFSLSFPYLCCTWFPSYYAFLISYSFPFSFPFLYFFLVYLIVLNTTNEKRIENF